MGVLNCNCLHNDTKNINEIITGNNLKAQKLVFALESCKTTLSPRNSSEFFNTSQNNNFQNNKGKNKEMSLRSKKESNTEEEIIINDIDYNTIEIICDNSDSNEEKHDKKTEKNNLEKIHNIKIKNKEELFGNDEDPLVKNKSSTLLNEKKISKENTNNNNNDSDIKIQNNLLINDQNNLNNFINEKIKEKRKSELENEKNGDKKEIDNKNYHKKYNLIIGNSALNYNYQYNIYNISYNDLGGNYNYIDQKIDEENEEYEQEKEIINISDINLNVYKSSTFSQCETKNLEKETIFEKQISTKSEEIKTRKETKNEGSNDNVPYYSLNEDKRPEERSAISYEIDYVEEYINTDTNNEETIKDNNLNVNNNNIETDNINEKDSKRLNFKQNIELKINDNINKIKDYHDQYIITDAFCDYDPEI